MSDKEEVFLRPVFCGTRFDGGRLPLEVVGELGVYRRIVLAVAKHLFKAKNKGRQRVPKGFEQDLVLYIREVEVGSAVPVVMRKKGAEVGDQLSLYPDYFLDARRMVAKQIAAPTAVESGFPTAVLRMFGQLGASLKEDEAIEFQVPEGPTAVYTQATRRRLSLLAGNTYDDEFGIVGHVTGLNTRKRTFEIQTGDGSVAGPLPEELVPAFSDVLGPPPLLVHVTGIGRWNANASLLEILSVDDVTLHDDDAERRDVHARLKVLAELDDGWLQGDGSAIPEPILRIGARLIERMSAKGVTAPYIYPTEGGGLSIEWSFRDSEVSVELDPQSEEATFFGLQTHSRATRESAVRLDDVSVAAQKLTDLVLSFAPPAVTGLSA